jgi:asparagine synthase (glutamine-hydrolysing)
VDRASQAFGVEVRSPFLDHRFVELAARIPSGLKLKHHRTKAIWRARAMESLPPSLSQLPKKGFGTPVAAWLKGSSVALLDELEERVAPWVKPEKVRTWKTEHMVGKADHRRRLWSLIILANWQEGPWGPGS